MRAEATAEPNNEVNGIAATPHEKYAFRIFVPKFLFLVGCSEIYAVLLAHVRKASSNICRVTHSFRVGICIRLVSDQK